MPTIINLNEGSLKGAGQYQLKEDWTGIIQSFELLMDPRDPSKVRCWDPARTNGALKPMGFKAYVLDPETGEIITGRWNAYWISGVPTPDNPQNVGLYTRFDEAIDLVECKQKGIALHVYRVDGRQKVELAFS